MTHPGPILACFAHPDDEVFGTGGTFAHYVQQGVDVYLVCATKGEAGEVAEAHLATAETLADVRTAELQCAAETLGLQSPIFLGYQDSGMAGTPENANPRAFINAPADAVVAQLVAVVRRLRPHAVVTFDHKGGYGHPDHIAIHQHTVAAVAAAGDPAFGPELGAPWQPERLFYRAMSRTQLETMRDELAAQGVESGFFAYQEEHGMVWEDEEVSLTMDVSATVAQKIRALHCHATQFGPDHHWRRAPEELIMRLMGVEHFVLASSTRAADRDAQSGSYRVAGLLD